MNNKYPPYTNDDDNWIMHLSAEDASAVLIEMIDIDSQLHAIYQTFKMIEKAKQDEREHIKELEQIAKETQENPYEPFSNVDRVIDAYHNSVYFDAANSMSTVGMIAPTMESILFEVFQNIGKKFKPSILKVNSVRNKLKRKEKFDCHYFYDIDNQKTGKNITKGTMQILEDTGFKPYFPADFEFIIDALFTYRNKMFHNGLEWPVKEREKFQRKIEISKWPESWFSCSTSDNQPWIYYMSGAFQSKCIDLFVKVINGIGRFYLDNENLIIIEDFVNPPDDSFLVDGS